MKRWRILSCDREEARKLAQEYGVSELVGVLLQSRGITDPEKIEAAFGKHVTFSDPLLMADMEKAVARIWRAVDDFEKVAVYGDYDADGITSTAMLYSYLESCGANVVYYIPEREGEGYGLNLQAIDKLHSQDVNLIITVDNGISSIEEVKYAKSLGMDVVITDHHRTHEQLPQACAVVDPYRPDCNSPYKGFSGVGVAFKLIMAMEGEDCDLSGLLENYADLVTIGTIADVVPLTGENRSFVRAGLRHISRTDRIGLRALMELAGLDGKPISSTSVAFGLVPRINATGRMGSPDRAVRLLISEYPDEASQLASDICDDNQYRRQIEAEIYEKVLEQLKNNPERLNDRILVIAGDDWHHGVIGIVSSRITEKFGKPSIIISCTGEEAKGSGRSVEGFSLFEAVNACADLLTRYGGHPMAAGLSLKTKDVETFRRRVNEYAAKKYPVMPVPVLTLDCVLKPSELSVELPESLQLLEPFGAGNPAPLFGLFHVKLADITPVGGGKHLRLSVTQDRYTIRCMCFGTTLEEFPYRQGDILDLAVTLESKEFNGQNTLSVFIKEIKLSDLNLESAILSRSVYEKCRRQEHLTPEECKSLLPNRDDFVVLYRYLKAQCGFSGAEEVLLFRIKESNLVLGKLLLELDVLEEHGLILQSRSAGNIKIELKRAENKVDLFDSEILSNLIKLQEGGASYGRDTKDI